MVSGVDEHPDKKITEALISAHRRGIDVQLILDRVSMKDYGKGRMLLDIGIVFTSSQNL